ncbi:MAG: TonB-dependent receptor, partial [Pseudomonadota bacterium]
IGGGGRFSIFAPNAITGAEFSPGGWSAAYGGRYGSLLNLDVAGGGPSPIASMRVDLAGTEFAYEGPSGVRDDTTMFATARRFDFGRVFETIDELDIGDPVLTDIILKTRSNVNDRHELETLTIVATEDFDRRVANVTESPNFDDVSLVSASQDLTLFGVTWRMLIGDSGQWENRLYLRDSEKLSVEGEAFPDLAPADTPVDSIPVLEELLTIDERETEIGWRSDYSQTNRFGEFRAGLRLTQTDADFSTILSQDWVRYVFEADDPRPPGQDFIVLTPDVINTRFSDSAIQSALFAEQVFVKGPWSVRPGLRIERDGFADETLVAPRLTVGYDAGANWRLTGTAGTFFESPRLLTRAADVENSLLGNERIDHVSVGAKRQIGDYWSVLGELYYQRLSDLIVDEGRANGRAANAGDGTNAGFDLVVDRRFRNGWSGNLTYSFNRQRLNDNDGRGEYTADFSREHFFTVSARWEINERWQLAWRWKYGSGRPDDRFDIIANVLPAGQPQRFAKRITTNNAITLDDYHGLNMRVDYRRPLGPVDLVAFIDVLNVYGGPNGAPRGFNYLNGTEVVEEDEAFPIIGLIFEKSW